MSSTKDISKLSFEEASAQLEAIVAKLESGEVDLDKAIELYAQGNLLKAHCEEKLKAAKLKVEKITMDEKSKVTLEQF